jgi:hypothetical protein
MDEYLAGGIGEDLEFLLARAYAVDIPADLGARLDGRVSRAVGHWRPLTSTSARLIRPSGRRLVLIPVLVLVLLAAVVVTVIGNGGTAASYESQGGYTWEHAEQLGLSQTVNGYKLTLERAYADANQMMVAITVVDTQNRGWHQVDVRGVSVSDGSEGEWSMNTGFSDPVSVTSTATLFLFDYSPGVAAAGRRAFKVTVSSVSVDNPVSGLSGAGPGWDPWHDVAVNVSFAFDLTVVGGSEATPRLSAEYNGVTFTLDRIVTAPSTVRVELHVVGLTTSDADRPLVFWVSHAGKDLGPGVSMSQGSRWTVYTQTGVDDPAGDWTVTIADAAEEIASGVVVPTGRTWTLQFSMP